MDKIETHPGQEWTIQKIANLNAPSMHPLKAVGQSLSLISIISRSSPLTLQFLARQRPFFIFKSLTKSWQKSSWRSARGFFLASSGTSHLLWQCSLVISAWKQKPNMALMVRTVQRNIIIAWPTRSSPCAANLNFWRLKNPTFSKLVDFGSSCRGKSRGVQREISYHREKCSWAIFNTLEKTAVERHLRR